MRRAPIVIAATAAGLVGVLSFHTSSAPLASGAGLSSGVGTGSTAGGGSTTGASKSTSGSTTTTSPSTRPTTATQTTTRTATGAQVNYNYGILAVEVTAQASKITNVKIASINEGGNQLSQSIDQQSIPMLEQEALQAQSGNIQSVSGASYTSAGFIQSLQSALGKLGLK